MQEYRLVNARNGGTQITKGLPDDIGRWDAVRDLLRVFSTHIEVEAAEACIEIYSPADARPDHWVFNVDTTVDGRSLKIATIEVFRKDDFA